MFDSLIVANRGEIACRLMRKDPTLEDTRARRGAESLLAPMPGKIRAVRVRAGKRVGGGQVLMVLEAMKMEHPVSAAREGVVERLCYAKGHQVAEGAELLVFAGAEK